MITHYALSVLLLAIGLVHSSSSPEASPGLFDIIDNLNLPISIGDIVGDVLGPLLSDPCTATPSDLPPDVSTMPTEFGRCVQDLQATKGKSHPLLGKKTDEVIKIYKFEPKVYTDVVTDDGYILTLHRIILPPLENNKKRTTVLLWHGLGGCSDNWTFNGRDQSLAFILADLGYDVWLGNSRGCSYSLGHEKLSSSDEINIDYWKFSWHENGMFDLPASIKYIRERNGNQKMFYVGHSQGCSGFVVGASTKPASDTVNADNIIAAFLLAPAVFLGRSSSPIRALTPIALVPEAYEATFHAFSGRIDTTQKMKDFLNVSLGNACTPTAVLCTACEAIMFALFGYDAPLMNYENLPNVLDKFPNIFPFKNLIHYGQSMVSCEFRQFDYGPKENKIRYGSATPPDYDLQKINVPSILYYGEKDNLCAPGDVIRLKENLKKEIVLGIYEVDSEYFNHLDFIMGKFLKTLLYDKITKQMETILAKGTL